MSAYVVFNVDVKDPEALKDYAKDVPATLEAFDGKLIAKGNKQVSLKGDSGSDIIGIFTFPDLDKANNWYNSDAYQSLIPKRDEAADITAVMYQA